MTAITPYTPPLNKYVPFSSEGGDKMLFMGCNFNTKLCEPKIIHIAEKNLKDRNILIKFVEFIYSPETMVLYETGPVIEGLEVQEKLATSLRDRLIKVVTWDITNELLNRTLEGLEARKIGLQKEKEYCDLEDLSEKRTNEIIEEIQNIDALKKIKELQLKLKGAHHSGNKEEVSSISNAFFNVTHDIRTKALKTAIDLSLKHYKRVIVLSKDGFATLPEKIPTIIYWTPSPQIS